MQTTRKLRNQAGQPKEEIKKSSDMKRKRTKKFKENTKNLSVSKENQKLSTLKNSGNLSTTKILLNHKKKYQKFNTQK